MRADTQNTDNAQSRGKGIRDPCPVREAFLRWPYRHDVDDESTLDREQLGHQLPCLLCYKYGRDAGVGVAVGLAHHDERFVEIVVDDRGNCAGFLSMHHLRRMQKRVISLSASVSPLYLTVAGSYLDVKRACRRRMLLLTGN